MYKEIYQKLVSSTQYLAEEWVKGKSGYHRHHIVPSHMGGEDVESNYCYLTVREHIIAHFLLWKIHGNVNDLRAMYMLGANITSQQRVVMGKWCAENKIGFFADKHKDERKEWIRRGIKTQQEKKLGIFNPDMLSEYATLGGAASQRSKNATQWGIRKDDPDRDKKRKAICSKGGKAMKGMVWMWLDGKMTKFKEELIEEKMKEGYRLYKYNDRKRSGKIQMHRNGETAWVWKVDQHLAMREGWKVGRDKSYQPDPHRKKSKALVFSDSEFSL